MSGQRRLAAGAAAAAAGGLLVWVALHGQGETAREKAPAAAPAGRVSRTTEGDPVLTMDAAHQARAGIETQTLAAKTVQQELAAYGRLEEDPSQSFVLRAPMAGVLHLASGRAWPSIGQSLADGAVVGTIEPRFTAADRISLTNQLSAARAEVNSGTVSMAAARASYERARLLNADNKNLSDRALQEAEARLKAEEARLRSATETEAVLESSLQSAGPAARTPLTMERGGDVVETLAQPGEAIESGSPILRVARLDRLLARVDLPAGQRAPEVVSAARIVPIGYEDQPIRAQRVALAATADPQTQGTSFLFRLAGTRFGLRPGLAVTAYLNLPGPARRGVVIPRAAVVLHSGKSYCYLQTAPDRFVRKDVPVASPVEGGYFAAAGFSAGDRVVVAGAQTLLSEEFKSQTRMEEEGT